MGKKMKLTRGLLLWINRKAETTCRYILTRDIHNYVIRLDPNQIELRELLREKVKEYLIREAYWEYNRERGKTTYRQESMHKRAIAERVLDRGHVSSADLARELRLTLGCDYSAKCYKNAFGVIADYVATGGENLLRREDDNGPVLFKD